MVRRFAGLVVALVLTTGPAAAQTPTFQAGVDVIALDVSVVDGQGRPVADLGPDDFVVEIEGHERAVLSAERVGVDTAPGAAPESDLAASTEAYYSTNIAPATGRRIVLAVDQSHLDATLARPIMRAATRLLDRLSPVDQVALITFPGTGPRLDFTDDHALVRRELERVVGQRPDARVYRFQMGLSEALAIESRERPQAATSTAANLGEPGDQPGIATVMERDCDAIDADGRDECRRQIVTEASTRVAEMRASARRSIDELEALVDALAPVDGPKSLVLISASLAIEDQREIERIAWRAGTGRTSIHVAAIDSAGAGEAGAPVGTELADRRVRFEGLEELARQSRGTYARIVGTGEEIFEHIASELSSSYIVGVEARSEDLDRDRLRVSVRVERPGVAIRTSPAFAAPPVPSDSRSVAEALRLALESPFGAPGLPVRVATFALRDAGSGRTRVTVAGQVGRLGAPDGEFTIGVLVVNADREVLTRSADRRLLVATTGDARLPYSSSMLLDAGTYSLRFGAVDDEGQVGSVVRAVRVEEPEAGAVEVSDLLVGALPRAGESLVPRIEPLVGTVGVVGYLEVYAPDAEALDRAVVTLEVANSAEGPALVTQTAQVRPGARPGWGVASGSVEVRDLVPGRYVLRARVSLDDDAVVRVRPFVFEGIGFTVASR
jgi:VWFA-related protein